MPARAVRPGLQLRLDRSWTHPGPVPDVVLSAWHSDTSSPRWESTVSETSSLRPEDIEVQTFAPLTPGFRVVDEDPTDPISGVPIIIHYPDGTIGRG